MVIFEELFPGVLQIKVNEFDWSTGSQSLIVSYDIIVKCPRNFEATFAVDEKKSKTNQTFVIVVRDSFRSTRLVAHRPTPAVKMESVMAVKTGVLLFLCDLLE